MSRNLISEEDIRGALHRGEKKLEVPPGSIITPLAAEVALANKVDIVMKTSPATAPTHEPEVRQVKETSTAGGIVVFGSDHGGFQYKELLKRFVEEMGHKVLDIGTHNEEPCDYPDFAYAVAIAVSHGEAWRGIMIDGAGIGSSIVANKVPGVRAACCYNEFAARNSREHNDANVLTLGSRGVGSEACKGIVKIWLETWFSGGRHAQRVEKITDVEKRFLK